MAREGTNITLSCKVKGYPLPTVTWEREGGQEISESKGRMSQVPPMIWIPHQLIFATTGDTVSLDCYTEAFPMSINYWTKADSCSILQPNEKFSVSISDNIYQVSMKLVISGVGQEDFGSYKCIAKNSLGSTEGVIRLYEAKATIYNRKEAADAEEEEGGEKSKSDNFFNFVTST
ncbi:triple functional domain protein [Trichonephila inaurata madagascariensis]|uniref:Triple functional domain protein n=1 Tax=Trichonephila inaurata madagascariensis TaxID=2747483 RepID=A0A8X7BU43_9ARAC|nr:triple functional domain protein [Trichonephila inaurata madagascariensis]